MNGSARKIEFCEGAQESRDEALSHFSSQKEAMSAYAQMISRLERLEQGAQLKSPDQMRKEAELPKGYFYAIKTPKRLRAYGWYSNTHKGVFFISHFAFKKNQKLDQKDTNKVTANWFKYEK